MNNNTPLAAKTATKFAYKLSLEDPTLKIPFRYYLSLSVLAPGVSVLDFKGIEVSKSAFHKVTSYDEAQTEANGQEVLNLMVPWHRVVSIENVLYRHRAITQTKEKTND